MKIKKILILVFLLMIGALIIIDTKSISRNVVDGIYICLNSIIPSLFAFLVFSSFILDSGLYRVVFKPLCILFKPIIKLCEPLTAIFILSMLGGYPVGAKLLSELHANGRITKRTAENMIQYCFCSGPSFIVGIVGIAVFDSVLVGFAIYLSNLLACLVWAAIVNRRNPITECIAPERIVVNAELFITSVQKSAKVLYLICIMIVAFSAGSGLMDILGINRLVSSFSVLGGDGENAVNILGALLEISGVSEIKPLTRFTIPIISALTSFGGICVLLQAFCICGKSFSIKKLIVSRLPCALLSFGFAYLMTFTFDISIETVALQAERQLAVFNNPIASACLVAMTGLLLIPQKKEADVVLCNETITKTKK